jgi:L-malate glycosyltransferase
MSSSGQGTEVEEADQPAAAVDSNLAQTEVLPGAFLMTNSFETGGSERQFALLARSLDRAFFHVHLGCIMQKGPFLEDLGKVPEFGAGGSLYGPRSWLSRLRLARHLRRHGIAIAHAFDFYTNLMLIPAARLARVPVVIGSQRQLGDLLTQNKFRAQVVFVRWCDVVVCNSRAAATRLGEQGIPERQLVVIGNGLPDSAFSQTLPAYPRNPAGVLRVGMIARMNTWSKNHRIVLGAAARLRDRFPNLEFLLAGDGPLRPELEREAERLGVADRVHFLGEQRNIPAFLASIDVSVLPSQSESLSNAIIESLAAGVPVVASRVGGNPELVTDHHGILVAPDDEQALANGIERVIRDPTMRAEFGRQAREFARTNFTIEHVRKQYEELYTELLTRKRWRPSSQPVSSRVVATEAKTPRVSLVAASLRYVGGQSAQADLLLRNWQNDSAIEARLIPIDPPLPGLVAWIERIPGLRTMVRQPLYLLKLWQELQDTDIAHIFSASYWSFLIAPAPAWLIAKLRGKKVLIHYHSGEARDHLRRFRDARYVLKRVDRLVVPSGYLADVFREFGLQAHVVPNIVDLSQFSYRTRRPVRPHLVCTRGFHRYYSVDVVVRAFAQVQRLFPDARLDLLGTGPTEKQIRGLVDELKLTGVKFTGVVSRQEIGRFYDQADIFINASWLDNMPVSVLEAFASGTPVVTTAPESMRYLVEHERTGLLSPPGDAHALAQNVLRLLENSELAWRLARSAYEESARYHWSAVREQWLKVYRSMACGNNEAAQNWSA